jgi:hypothetical protein
MARLRNPELTLDVSHGRYDLELSIGPVEDRPPTVAQLQAAWPVRGEFVIRDARLLSPVGLLAV